jgi:hypothetical protein
MRPHAFALAVILCAGSLVALSVTPAFAKSHRVRAYTTKRGTYVQPHRQTDADHSKLNNWSTKGNTNPYTGKPGTKDPYAQKHH